MKLLFASLLAGGALATSDGSIAGVMGWSKEARQLHEAKLAELRQDTCKATKLTCPKGKTSCFCRDTKKKAKCALDLKELREALKSDGDAWRERPSGYCRDKLKRCVDRDPKAGGGCQGNRCMEAGKDATGTAGGNRWRCIPMPSKCLRIVNERVCPPKHRKQYEDIGTYGADDKKWGLCCKNCYRKKPKQPCLNDQEAGVEYKGVVAIQKQGGKGVKTWSTDKSMVRSKIKMCCLDNGKQEVTERKNPNDPTKSLNASFLKVKTGNNSNAEAQNEAHTLATAST